MSGKSHRRRQGKARAHGPAAPAAAPATSGSAAAGGQLRSLPLRVARSTAAVVGFAATLLGIVFVLWPALKPAGPPAVKGVTLDNLQVDRRSFAQYLQQVQLSAAPYEPATLGARGTMVTFHYVIDGFKGKHLPLRWQLIDARSGNQVAQSSDLRIIPSAPQDAANWYVWIPGPSGRTRQYYVQLQLYDEHGRFPVGEQKRTPDFSGI